MNGILLLTCLLAAAEPQVADRWAVLVGVDDYANAQDLAFCGADQRDLSARLKTCGFPDEHLFLLHDKASDVKYRPSKGNVERQLNVVLNLADANDLLIVALSGHGVSLDGKSYFCPNDATLDDPATLISLDTLYERLDKCAARFKLILVDACRNDPRLGRAKTFSATDGTRELARSLQEIKLPQGVVLLNSCAPGEISWEETQFGHGVYMYYVLEALSGAADVDADGAVSLSELQRYAGTKTKTYVARRFSESQRPFFKSEGESNLMEYALLPVKANARTVPAMVRPETVPPVSGIPATVPNTVRPTGNESALLKTFREEFVRITPGTAAYPAEFSFGGDAAAAVRVTFAKPFSIAKYEVPQNLWQAVMGSNPSKWQGPRNSVEMLSLDEANEFCRRATARLREAGLIGPMQTVRLPSEAEWEYCTRAGTKTKFSFGDDVGLVDQYGWHNQNAAGNDPPVGAKKPNPWGLYDVHGYLWEWCSDAWTPMTAGTPQDGSPRTLGDATQGVLRGGSWKTPPEQLTSDARRSAGRNTRDDDIGLRCVLTE
jgi:formylglycine-generating enzyme required for sulfatase activity